MRSQVCMMMLVLAAGLGLVGPAAQCQAACEGDANGDGLVDPLDSGFVLARFGCTYPEDGENCAIADQNGDGLVDPLDVGFILARFGPCPPAPPVLVDTVPVGNPGNAGELSGEGANGSGPDRICGAVDYAYNIGTYEVTAGQYTEFLNAMAATDTYGLYNSSMWSHEMGCKIEQSGSWGSYTYSVAGDWANRPVNWVSWGDAARFANWLHNGQPTGAQDLTTTEDGSYFLDGALQYDLTAITREPDATWVTPSEDEWYKAAYHYNDGVTGNYWNYPMGSETAPNWEAPPGTDMTNGSANFFTNSDDYAIGPPYYRTEVGAYNAKPSDSPYGTFDQGGNVWEWNEEIVVGTLRGIRGGSFNTYGDDLRSSYRSYTLPGYEGISVGFRVAEVP